MGLSGDVWGLGQPAPKRTLDSSWYFLRLRMHTQVVAEATMDADRRQSLFTRASSPKPRPDGIVPICAGG